jgi:hypothetical protein
LLQDAPFALADRLLAEGEHPGHFDFRHSVPEQAFDEDSIDFRQPSQTAP